MVRISGLCLFLSLLSACRTDPAATTLAAAKRPEIAPAEKESRPTVLTTAPLDSCSKLDNECSTEEQKIPYQCVAYRLAGKLLWEEERVYAWGANLCLARHGLLLAACARNLQPAQLGDIHCGPDPSSESCPIASGDCPADGIASRCTASQYKDQSIPWSEQPVGWGPNECKAKELLLASACQRGLDPRALGNITCEENPAAQACPPAAPTCDDNGSVPTVCQVSTIGDITLKKPWAAEGGSRCEAQYRLKQLACRFTDAAKKLTPEQLGSMECRSL